MINRDRTLEIWHSILKTSLKIPGAKINRKKYLENVLSKRCTGEQVEAAIKSSPAEADIPVGIIEEISRDCINSHTAQAAALSFLAGLPGGWWMFGTITADLTQFYWQVIRLMQKLAYLYGWPDLFEGNSIDDETLLRIKILLSVMFGSREAVLLAAKLSKRLTVQIAKDLPQKLFTRYGVYTLAVQAAKWIGIRASQESFARGVSKAIPLLGGYVSAGVSLLLMKKMGNNLKKYLSEPIPAGFLLKP
ncbi:MAG: hypothetical protein CVU88_00585 [Firmicutes bacterium HGW-Firmicutes-13]|nr:MAG: hypothetical protein CVU88_00585 [Firmicutes bacterium HGW-Firmicutes-13]